jgi:hypothetical protein
MLIVLLCKELYLIQFPESELVSLAKVSRARLSETFLRWTEMSELYFVFSELGLPEDQTESRKGKLYNGLTIYKLPLRIWSLRRIEEGRLLSLEVAMSQVKMGRSL